jgi:hypothetical protein
MTVGRQRAAIADVALHPLEQGPGGYHYRRRPHQRPDEGHHRPQACHQQHEDDEYQDGRAQNVGL